MSSSTDGLDDLLQEIGMGRWQILGLVANFLIWSVLSPHTIGTTLLNAPVPFQCLSTDQADGSTHLSFFNASLVHEAGGDAAQRAFNATSFDNKCLQPTIEDARETPMGGTATSNASSFVDPLSEPLLPSCPIVRYDDSIFSSTITTEWHLVCEQSGSRTLFQNAYTIGMIIGCFIGGDIGDRLGRARAVLVGSFIHVIFSLIVAFTTNFALLIVSRFFVGLTNLMILVPIVTLSMETCPEKYRGPIGMLVGMPYSLGVVVFAGLGVFLRDWRYLYIATSFPALLLLPVAWLLDESPRWLLQVGRLEEATEIIEKAAKINRYQFDSMERVHLVLKEVSKREEMTAKKDITDESWTIKIKILASNALGALKTPAMRKISIISPTIWFLNEVVYYGTIFNANSFSSDNPFLYVALTGVADGLAIVLGCVGTYFGRKMTVAGSQYISGTLLLLVLAVPEWLKWLQWIFVMTGFLMCACASQALFVYTPELFPTTIRARGFAFCNLTGYTGTLVAPFIPDMLAQYGWWITGTILGSIGLITGTMTMSMIETNHLPMCETIQDIEDREKMIQVRKKSSQKAPEETTTEKQQAANDIPLSDPSSGFDNPALERTE